MNMVFWIEIMMGRGTGLSWYRGLWVLGSAILVCISGGDETGISLCAKKRELFALLS